MSVELSVVIPALNEAERLPPSLDRIFAYLSRNAEWLPAELIVVDDGSSDGTAEAVARVPPCDGADLKTLIHPRNLGKGAAVRSGFAASSGSWVLLSDADLSAPIEEISVLRSAAADGGVVIGSRAIDRRLVETRQPVYRDLMGRTFNLVVRLLALGDLYDTQCGFKLFPGKLARHLAAVQRLDGFAFDVELLVLARTWGYAIHEVGVRWRHVEASRVAPVPHAFEMLRDLLRLWWWRTTGRLSEGVGVVR